MAETLEEKIQRVLRDRVEIAPYDPVWPERFREERERLLARFPTLIRRIEHVGSTAVPGLAAKPVVDLLIEVESLDRARAEMPEILEGEGYDYFWRPSHGESEPPFYAWFIRRDDAGHRTHHLHCVERDFPQWDWVLFRDHLLGHPEVARDYAELKRNLALANSQDRIAYTKAKGDFIRRYTDLANGDKMRVVTES